MKTFTKLSAGFAIVLLLVMSASCNLPKRPVTPRPSPTNTAQAQVSDTPSPSATATYIVGDLGWGPIHGKITDAVTGLPVVGANVTCRHSSYTSPALCNTSALTDAEGDYLFPDIFFHDTDRIQVEVQARGYVTQALAINFITTPGIIADFALVPAIHSETPPAVCTPPACGPYDALYCPQGDCPGGCGMVCATPAAICTPPLCAIGTNEVYYCSEVCPGGCGTTCATITPGP